MAHARVPRETDLKTVVVSLVSDDCTWSCGNAAGVGLCCVFGLTVLKYWFVNGLFDFSTALVVGAVASTAGLAVRLGAYVLVVPFFLGLRLTYYLAHPSYRDALLSGQCPETNLLSLDWFTVGILATGLPIALRDFGPWVGMNAVFLVGLFVVPRFVDDDRRADAVKLGAIAGGSLLFLYANYGGPAAALTPLPHPAGILGPVATTRLPDATVGFLFRLANSLLVGPVLVAGFALLMNRLLTHPTLTTVPVVHHALPRRDPAPGVVVSAAVGTAFYLLVVAAATGTLVVVP